jgi:tRNA (adenine57-N1/adenine58-N1)-methyltransferase catalytic subunit
MEINHTLVRAGDLVQLIDPKQHTFIIVLNPGGVLQTHRGILPHDDLIGKPWGSEAFTHLGYRFLLLRPTLSDVILRIKRTTQIMYPKDIGFILVMMGIGPGQFVIEAGTGSGAFTAALAYAVGTQGRVVTYENRPEMQALAQANLEQLGLMEQVTFKSGDVRDGFDEQGADALFLDLPYPEECLAQVRGALATGNPFGCLVPTANQVSRVITGLRTEHFGFIEVCETFLRYYKPIPERLRPADRMVGHTGYLIFARPLAETAGFTTELQTDERGSDEEHDDGEMVADTN